MFVTVLFTTPHLSGDLVISISLLAGQFGGGDRSLLSREKSTNMRTLIALSLAISAAAAQVELGWSSDLRKLKYLSLPGTLGPPPELHAGRLPAGDFKGIRQLHVRDRRELVHQEGMSRPNKVTFSRAAGFYFVQIACTLYPTARNSITSDGKIKINTWSTFKSSELIFELNKPFQVRVKSVRLYNLTSSLDNLRRQRLMAERSPPLLSSMETSWSRTR